MGFVWNWYAVPGILGAIFAVVLAIVTIRAAKRDLTNWMLFSLLMLEGITMATGAGFRFALDGPQEVYSAAVINSIALGFLVPLYMIFLGRMLQGTLAMPLRHPLVILLLLILTLMGQAWGILDRTAYVGELFEPGYAPWDARDGYLVAPFVLASGLAFIYALVASGISVKQARSAEASRNSKAFFFAFGVRDAFYGTFGILPYALPDAHGEVMLGIVRAIALPAAGILFIAILGHRLVHSPFLNLNPVTIRSGLLIAAIAGFAVTLKFIEIYASASASAVFAAFAGGLLVVFAPRLNRWVDSKAIVPSEPIGAATKSSVILRYLEELRQRGCDFDADAVAHLRAAAIDAGVDPQECDRILRKLKSETK